MMSSTQDIVLFLALAALLPPIMFWPLRRAVAMIAPNREESEGAVLAGGLALLATFLCLLPMIPMLDSAISLLPLAAALVLAAAVGIGEQLLRPPTQITIAARFVLASAWFLLGFRFRIGPVGGDPEGLGGLLLDYFVTVLFHAGLMTSLNIFDRLRGLATGVTLIIGLTLTGLVLNWSSGGAPVILMAISGTCLGHLLLNQWQDRLRLGIAGQFMLAILLASTTISSRTWGFTLGMFLITLMAVAVPMFDRVYTGLVRLSTGKQFDGTGHLRSLMLEAGFTERWVVFAIWIVVLQVGVLVNVVYATESLLIAFAGGGSLLALYAFGLLLLARFGERMERARDPLRLRILFLSHYFHPEVNAPASRLYEHARRWTRAGHEVTVITNIPSAPHGWPYAGYSTAFWREENVDGIRTIRVWSFVAANKGRYRRMLNYLSYFASAQVALLLLRRHDVMVATSPQFFCGMAGAVGSLFRKEPFILEIRDIWPESIVAVGAGRRSTAYRILQGMARWMYRRARLVVTVGDGYRGKLLESGAIEAARIAVIPNGIDFDLFHPPEGARRRVLLAKHGIADEFVVTYAGTLGMAHGLEVVLRAAHRLAARRDIVFVLAGDGAERAHLEREAARLGLDRVLFLGLLPKEQIPILLAESDACLVHLRREELFETVMPSKLFEAMGVARPVLLGVRGDAAELLATANAGLCFPPEDDAELALVAQRLAGNRELAEALGNNGAAFVMARQSRDRFAAEYLEVMRRVSRGSEAADMREASEAGPAKSGEAPGGAASR